MSPQPELRISDAEREAAVTALGEHYAAGRLTKEEYDERADQAWEAKTRSALVPLFVDLPRPQAATRSTYDRKAPSRTFAQQGDRRGHPGWWAGAGMLPILLVVLALVLLTELPWFVLLIVAWVMWAKMFRHWGHSRRC